MIDPNLIILYVDSPDRSARFYTELLHKQPVLATPSFAKFKLDSGLMLGLWARQTVTPRSISAGRAGELAIPVADREAVFALHADWTRRGIPIALPPTELDIGHTFVGLDPDGHRLRVIARKE
ncbi:drug:proton antiporter [Bordetella genomosp. 7]|uniref:Drug:proton antiporter n=1 Tax=Bordetella genomosp. 7 TaxID=1416805 RepID=A0A261RKK7_9BORD|nr:MULTISPECIES: VOC family protein [Bordetella]OZI24148.1 drug:proton antiporter [Bordetella genomosp. 7]OZI25202.1 drug:proton antiporter [Bordetella genomosp. 7]